MMHDSLTVQAHCFVPLQTTLALVICNIAAFAAVQRLQQYAKALKRNLKLAHDKEIWIQNKDSCYNM